MIGGIDIRIPTQAGLSSTESSVRAIRQSWPHAVFENGLTGDKYESFWEIPFGEVKELFVYRDSGAEHIWDEEGAITDTQNSMIHLITDPDMLTVVIDERDREMETILAAVRSCLRDEILNISALLEAA